MNQFPTAITLTQAQWQHLTAHCNDAFPNEACGLLLGCQHVVLAIQPLPNRHPQPATAFFAEPLALLATYRWAAQQGWQVLAVYHSHPDGSTQLSATDLEGQRHLPGDWLLASANCDYAGRLCGWRWQWFSPHPEKTNQTERLLDSPTPYPYNSLVG